jgi:serine/threonine protein kinase
MTECVVDEYLLDREDETIMDVLRSEYDDNFPYASEHATDNCYNDKFSKNKWDWELVHESQIDPRFQLYNEVYRCTDSTNEEKTVFVKIFRTVKKDEAMAAIYRTLQRKTEYPISLIKYKYFTNFFARNADFFQNPNKIINYNRGDKLIRENENRLGDARPDNYDNGDGVSEQYIRFTVVVTDDYGYSVSRGQDLVSPPPLLSAGEIVKMTFDILDAILYLHKNDYTHLDLVPTNIVRNNKSRWTVIDLGLSQSVKCSEKISDDIGFLHDGFKNFEHPLTVTTTISRRDSNVNKQRRKIDLAETVDKFMQCKLGKTKADVLKQQDIFCALMCILYVSNLSFDHKLYYHVLQSNILDRLIYEPSINVDGLDRYTALQKTATRQRTVHAAKYILKESMWYIDRILQTHMYDKKRTETNANNIHDVPLNIYKKAQRVINDCLEVEPIKMERFEMGKLGIGNTECKKFTVNVITASNISDSII